MTISVPYYRKLTDIPGRRYAAGPAAQKLSREARAVAFRSFAVDLDQENAVPCGFYRELSKTDTFVAAEYVVWKLYLDNREYWLSVIARYYDITRDDAKVEILKLHYGGRPSQDLPMLWAYARELTLASSALLGLPAYAYLKGLFTDRPNPAATRISYAVAAEEDRVLLEFEPFLLDKCPEVRVVAYMLDGLIVAPVNPHTNKIQDYDLEGTVKEFEVKTGIVVKQKQWGDA